MVYWFYIKFSCWSICWYDNPKNLGKYETGSKTAMPIFKDFIKKAVNNYEARPFKIAKNIKMMVIDAETGKKADFGSKKTIIESFKKKKKLKINYILVMINLIIKN